MKIMQLVLKDFSPGTVQAETLTTHTHTYTHEHTHKCTQTQMHVYARV